MSERGMDVQLLGNREQIEEVRVVSAHDDERPSTAQLRSLLRPQHGRDLEAGLRCCRRSALVQPFGDFEYRLSQNWLQRDRHDCLAKQQRTRSVTGRPR